MRANRGLLALSTTVLSLLFLFVPLLLVVLFSFHSTAGLSFPFEGFSLRWYRQLLEDAEFRRAAENSLIVASTVSVVTLFTGTAAAYGLSRLRGRLRGVLTVLFFLPITLPGLFIGVALLVLFVRANLQLSLATVVLGHFVYVLPYFMLIAVAAFARTDVAMEEAATDLGATPRQVFVKVTLPQLWPVLLGAAALAFVLSFDEFVITFFVIGDTSTLPLFIWSSLRRTVTPEINAVSSLLLVSSLILFAVTFIATTRSSRRREGTDLGLPSVGGVTP